MKFKRITIEGFSSIIYPTSFELDRGGVFLVNGENGAGKTTLFSALVWCLYGKDLKGVTKNKIPTKSEYRPDSFAGTQVKVHLYKDDNDYVIARHIGYKKTIMGRKGNDKLLVFKNSKLDDSLHIKDSQSYINDLIGMDYRAFTNSVVFGQRMKRLIEADNTEKRQLFEQYFNTEWVDAAQIKAKEQLNILVDDIKVEEQNIHINNAKINSLNGEIERYNEYKKDYEYQKTVKLKELQTKITELNSDKKLLQVKLIKEKQQLHNLYEDQHSSSLYLDDLLLSFYKEELELLIKNIKDEEKGILEELNTIENDKKSIQLPEEPNTKTYIEKVDKLKNALNDLKTNKHTNEQQIIKCKDQIDKAKENIENFKESKDSELICKFCSKQFPTEFTNPIIKKWDNKIQREVEVIERMQYDIEMAEKAIPIDYDKLSKQLETDLIEAKNDLDNISQQVKYFSDLKYKLQDYEKQYQSKLSEFKEVQKEIEAAKTILDSNIIKHKNYRPFMLFEEATFLQNNINDLKETEKAIKDINDSINTSQAAIQNLESKITNYDSNISIYQKQKTDIENEKFNMNIDKQKQEKEALEIEITESKKRIDLLSTKVDHTKWWIKAYSSTGIKSYLLDQIIMYLNERVNVYSGRLGLEVKFYIDYDKASKPFETSIYKNGSEIAYDMLSGGEKQQIDISLAFATHDLASNENPCNLLVMDEVFEGLDKSNIEIVFDLIRLKATNKTVYVITHIDTIDSKMTKSIYITKKDNCTVIK